MGSRFYYYSITVSITLLLFDVLIDIGVLGVLAIAVHYSDPLALCV